MARPIPSWWDPAGDPGHAEVWASAIALARHDQPDVLMRPSELPPGFHRIATLCVQRLQSLQVEAIRAAAEDVEFIVANFHIIGLGLLDGATTAIPELQTSSNSRAQAKKVELARNILRARERVITVHENHLANLANTIAYAIDAMADLDRLIKWEHRFGRHLSYQVPTTVAVPNGVQEIGLARVHAVLPSVNQPTNNESDQPNQSPERGAA